jgi:hypothetical protein
LVDPEEGLLLTYPPTFKAEDLRADLTTLLAARPASN